MGQVRENLAGYIKDKNRAYTAYEVYYAKALSVLASGMYKDPHKSVDDIAGKMIDILYNKEVVKEETRITKDISSMNMGEIKEYWKEMTGEDWSSSSSSS
tara:strand:- start:1240 stop:1539 length:300 start_codon:yes stop_codon:yes gene_type:complete